MKRTRTAAPAVTLLLADAASSRFIPAFVDKAITLTERELAARMTRLLPELTSASSGAPLRAAIRRLKTDTVGNATISFASTRRLVVRVVRSEMGGPQAHAAHECIFADLTRQERSRRWPGPDRRQDFADLGLLLRFVLLGRSGPEIATDLQTAGIARGTTRQNVDQRLYQAVRRSMRRAFVAYLRDALAAHERQIQAQAQLADAQRELKAASRAVAAMSGVGVKPTARAKRLKRPRST